MNYIPGAEPLELTGSDKGILLLHGGGGGTTWDLKEFARYSNEKGYSIILPALTGYGTSPEDLKSVSVDDWIKDGMEAITKLSKTCEKIAVVGHSLGGLLTLILASRNRNISNIVTWAAPWWINNRLFSLLPVLTKIPFLPRIIPEKMEITHSQDLLDQGWIGYDWLPTSLGMVLHEILNILHKEIGNVSCPSFIIQGKLDNTIESKSALKIYERINNSQKQIWLIEDAQHALMQESCKYELFDQTLSFIEDHF